MEAAVVTAAKMQPRAEASACMVCVSLSFLLHLDIAWVACAQVFDLSDEEAVSEAFASELRDFLQVVAHA